MAIDSDESLQNTSSELETSSQCSLVVNDSEIKLSKRRWLILAGITTFGLLMTFSSQTSPVLETMLEVVGLRIDKYLYLEQIFSYQMALISIPTARFVDKYGLKPSMYLATALVVVQTIFRGLLYNIHLPYWKDYRILYYICGNVVGCQVIAIFICLPLKTSEIWFSESERSVAWTVMSSFPNISIALASYLYPKLIQSLEDVKLLFSINTVSAVIIIMSTVIFVTRSRPRHPANARIAYDQSRDKQSFLVSVKKILKQRDLTLHLIHTAIFNSIYSTVVSVIPDILESSNHSEIFTGDLNTLFHISTLILGLIFARFVHKAEDPTLICKVAGFLQAVAYVTYLSLMLRPVPAWYLYMASFTFAIIHAWCVPNFTNMTAHLASGTVSHATVIGVILTLAVLAGTLIRIPFVALIEVHKKKSNYSWAIAFISIACMINTIIFCVFFRGRSAKQLEETTTERVNGNQVSV